MGRGPHPRTSRSCGICRAIKRRCDQKLPSCGQCTRMREECPGYRDEWDLVFRDQTDHTIKRSKKKTAKRETVAKNTNSIPPSTPSLSPSSSLRLSPSHNEIGVNYFLHNFVAGSQGPSRGYLNYIPAVCTADDHHPALAASMAAVGLVTLANTARQPELAKLARIKYSEAINQVNIALASPTESIKDSTLMSVISLVLFEYHSGIESWARHVHGAGALVAARGKSQFSTTAAILMFNQVRADTVAACIHGEKPFPEDMYKLQEEAAKRVDTTSVFWRLGVVATRCTNLLWDVKKKRREISLYDLLEQATGLQEELQHIFGILSTKSPYTTYRQPGGDPEIFYHERFDLYANTWAIRVWNSTRILQTKVCDSIGYVLSQILATDLNPVVQAHMELKLQDTLGSLSKLGNDMIATLPQALGFVSSASEISHAVDISSSISGSAGYMMTRPLYTAGKSSAIESEARKWIIRRLLDFGHIAGITLALQLVDEVIEIDQYAN